MPSNLRSVFVGYADEVSVDTTKIEEMCPGYSCKAIKTIRLFDETLNRRIAVIAKITENEKLNSPGR